MVSDGNQDKPFQAALLKHQHRHLCSPARRSVSHGTEGTQYKTTKPREGYWVALIPFHWLMP